MTADRRSVILTFLPVFDDDEEEQHLDPQMPWLTKVTSGDRTFTADRWTKDDETALASRVAMAESRFSGFPNVSWLAFEVEWAA